MRSLVRLEPRLVFNLFFSRLDKQSGARGPAAVRDDPRKMLHIHPSAY